MTDHHRVDHRIGYARCSTSGQDLEAQTANLERAGVPLVNIYTDWARSGANRARPGLDNALAALRGAAEVAKQHPGETATLVVPKLDRLGRSLADLRDIADEIDAVGGRLEFAGTIHDPHDPASKLFFSMLALFAEFERDLIAQRTREGLEIAKAAGKLKGRAPALSQIQQKAVVDAYLAGNVSMSDLARGFGVGVATIHRTIKAARKNERICPPKPSTEGTES